jgi:hypothetical protein
MSTSPQPKPTNGYPHDKSLRIPSRHPRPDSPPASTVNGNSLDVKGASPGSATRFGWQFSSHEIAHNFLISSQTRADLSILHPLCIDRLVVLSVLEYQATFLCAHRARCQRSRSGEAVMVRRSRKATNAQRPNSRKPTV